jgi:hypothetical protein
MGLVTYGMALLQVSSTIVAKLAHEPHILQHFLCNMAASSSLGHNTFEHVMGKLDRLCILPGLGILLLELLRDLINGVVICGAVDSFPQSLLTVQQDALDEFARVICRIKKRNRCSARDGKGEGPSIVRRSLAKHASRDVGHEESWKEEGCRNSQLADISLNSSLRVKVLYFTENAFGQLRDIQERTPDEVLDSSFLSSKLDLGTARLRR